MVDLQGVREGLLRSWDNVSNVIKCRIYSKLDDIFRSFFYSTTFPKKEVLNTFRGSSDYDYVPGRTQGDSSAS